MPHNEGYLMIDHRESPGMPPGHGVVAGQLFESAIMGCKHCRAVVVLNPLRTRERARCTRCDGYICDPCAAQRECTPFEAKIDALMRERERAIAPGSGLILPPT